MVTMPATLSIGENINPALTPANPPPDTTPAAAAAAPVTVMKKRRPPRRYNLSLPTFSWGGAQRIIPRVKDPNNIPPAQAALSPLPPKEKEKGKESVAAAAAEIPWKLRKRKAENGPAAAESAPPPPVAAPKEKVKRISTKLTVPLSAMEIREDFLLMRGKKPASRPKKRPKHVQKLLDELFPGLWLSEITPDLYRVDEEEEGACDSDS